MPTTAPTLTPRQTQILHGIAKGHHNTTIGKHLNLTENTVKTHARRLFTILGATGRAHAVALAYEHGLLEPGHLTQTATP